MSTQTDNTVPRDMSRLFRPGLDVRRMVGTAAPMAERAVLVGQRMHDGSIYAGLSPDTGRPMYTTPKDIGLCAEWRKAMRRATSHAHGHKDWRVPTRAELNVLFNNRAAIGNLNETGSSPDGWYWSSTQHLKDLAWAQRFMDGHQFSYRKDVAASLRCVRG